VELVSEPRREYRLREFLEPVAADYDFVFIDCPPSLGLLTLNALVAADSVLIPLQCEFFALAGVSELLSTVGRVRASFNPKLAIEGIVFTMVDERTNLTSQVMEDVRQNFPGMVYRSIIPRNVRLAEAPSFGVPAMLHDKDSRGALAYLALAGEMIRRDDPDALPLDEPPAQAPAEPEPEPAVAAAEQREAVSEPAADESPQYPPPAIPYLSN
jgi:chromosome partitioning protein